MSENDYTYAELGYLLSCIWDYKAENISGRGDDRLDKLQRNLLTSCFRWPVLKDLIENKEVIDMLTKPLEEIPLDISSKASYKKVIYKWRLKIGK